MIACRVIFIISMSKALKEISLLDPSSTGAKVSQPSQQSALRELNFDQPCAYENRNQAVLVVITLHDIYSPCATLQFKAASV
jgi:hypothetical protein